MRMHLPVNPTRQSDHNRLLLLTHLGMVMGNIGDYLLYHNLLPSLLYNHNYKFSRAKVRHHLFHLHNLIDTLGGLSRHLWSPMPHRIDRWILDIPPFLHRVKLPTVKAKYHRPRPLGCVTLSLHLRLYPVLQCNPTILDRFHYLSIPECRVPKRRLVP
jgi:hypothetical protein